MRAWQRHTLAAVDKRIVAYNKLLFRLLTLLTWGLCKNLENTIPVPQSALLAFQLTSLDPQPRRPHSLKLNHIYPAATMPISKKDRVRSHPLLSSPLLCPPLPSSLAGAKTSSLDFADQNPDQPRAQKSRRSRDARPRQGER